MESFSNFFKLNHILFCFLALFSLSNTYHIIAVRFIHPHLHRKNIYIESSPILKHEIWANILHKLLMQKKYSPTTNYLFTQASIRTSCLEQNKIMQRNWPHNNSSKRHVQGRQASKRVTFLDLLIHWSIHVNYRESPRSKRGRFLKSR